MKNWYKKKSDYKKAAIKSLQKSCHNNALKFMLPEIWLAFNLVGRLQKVESDQSINPSSNQI